MLEFGQPLFSGLQSRRKTPRASLGGNRYLMHGGRSADGRSAFKLSTDVREILHELFPAFKLGSAFSSSSS